MGEKTAKQSGRGDRSTNAAVQARRQLVLRYFLIGLGATEIAPIVHIPLRTIQRDLEELRIWITQETEIEQIRTLKQSLLTWQQAHKEMWALYFRPTKPGESDTNRKLGAMAHIIQINRELDGLMFRPPTKEIIEIRREFTRVKSEYELAKRNGLLR